MMKDEAKEVKSRKACDKLENLIKIQMQVEETNAVG